MTQSLDDILEEYCSDCGCISDDEICPRCQSEMADAQRRDGNYSGDRRWNGQVMAHRNTDLDSRVLSDIREKPGMHEIKPIEYSPGELNKFVVERSADRVISAFEVPKDYFFVSESESPLSDIREKPGMSPELRMLIEKARHYKITPEERREQRISLAYGNLKLHRPDVTKDEIIAVAKRLDEQAQQDEKAVLKKRADSLNKHRDDSGY